MALAEQSRVRLNLTGSTSDTTYDTLIGLVMTEADQQIKDELFLAAKEQGNITALPIIDVTNATLDGSAVPQHVKDMASNRASSLAFTALAQRDRAKDFMDMSNNEITNFVRRLGNDNGAATFAIV